MARRGQFYDGLAFPGDLVRQMPLQTMGLSAKVFPSVASSGHSGTELGLAVKSLYVTAREGKVV